MERALDLFAMSAGQKCPTERTPFLREQRREHRRFSANTGQLLKLQKRLGVRRVKRLLLDISQRATGRQCDAVFIYQGDREFHW